MPSGTSTVPPVPAAASIAAWIDAVSSVLPSPLAPLSLTLTISGDFGATAQPCPGAAEPTCGGAAARRKEAAEAAIAEGRRRIASTLAYDLGGIVLGGAGRGSPHVRHAIR